MSESLKEWTLTLVVVATGSQLVYWEPQMHVYKLLIASQRCKTPFSRALDITRTSPNIDIEESFAAGISDMGLTYFPAIRL